MSHKVCILRWQIPELASFSGAQRRFIRGVAMRVLRRDDFLCWAFIRLFSLVWITLLGLTTVKLTANFSGFMSWVIAIAAVGIGVIGLLRHGHITLVRIQPIVREIVSQHGERIQAIRDRFGFKDSVGCALHIARHLVRTIRFRSALPFVAYLALLIFVFITERPDSAGSVGVVDIRLNEAGYLATNSQTSEQIGWVSRVGSDDSTILLEITSPFNPAPQKYKALGKLDGEILGEFDSETLKSSPFAGIEMTGVEHYFERIDSPID
jgi:hypothetical protein